MSPSSRKCSFPHETQGLELLSNYTKEGCVYECMIKKAREACRCTPWDFPQTGLFFTLEPLHTQHLDNLVKWEKEKKETEPYYVRANPVTG